MAELNKEIKPKKRLAWARRIGWVAGGLVVLLVLAYFVVASSAFVRGVVLPRLDRALNAQITVGEISFSPMSQIVLRGFKLQTTGAEPLLQAEEALLRYNIGSMIKGRIDVGELKLVSPRLQVVQNADGTSNLDPLLKALAASRAGGAVSPKTAGPTQIALRNVVLSQGVVRWVKESKGGERQTAELSNLSVTLDQLQNAQSGKLTLSAEGKFERIPAAKSPATTNDLLLAKVSGSYNFKLDAELLPQTLEGTMRFEAPQAQGAWSELAGLDGTLECQLTPTEVRQLALRFQRQGNSLGQLRISGPVDLAKTEGRLKLEILSIDRQVLNLFGASRGWDFAQSIVNSTNRIDVSQQGNFIAANGRLTGSRLSVHQKDQATPAVDLDLDYQFNFDLKSQAALIQRLNLSGIQGTNELLRAQLNRPMNLSWGAASGGFKESAFEFSVTNLNLAEWNLLMGNGAPTGRVALSGKIISQEDGKQLAGEFSAQGRDLTVQWATNRLALARFQGQVKGKLEEFQKLSVDPYNFEISETNQTLVSGNGALNYNLKQGDLRLRATLEAALPGLLKKYPYPPLQAAGGTVRFSGLFSREKQTDTVNGTMSLADFTGQYGVYQFQNFHAGLEADLELKDQQVQINRANITPRQGFDSGGSINVSGRYDLKQNTAQLTFSTIGLNQNALAPFLTPWLAPRALVSASINANGSASYDPQKDSSLKADIKVANLALKDPKNPSAAVPVNAQVQLDGSIHLMQQLRLNQVAITFLDGADPCGRADVSGTLDLAQSIAQLTFKVADLNQRALAPWVASWLAPKTLISVSVNANGVTSYDPKKDSTLKAQLSVTNLVVNDPAKTLPAKPLQATLQLDGSMRQNIVELRQFVVGLSPTARATNQLEFQGRLDLSRTNAVTGQLALHSDSLDLTPAYEMFTAAGSTNPPAASPPAAPAASTNAAPATTALPLQDFQFESKIDRLYLGEIAITNWQTSVKINANDIALNPIQLTLNGGSITGKAILNLDAPGYTKDLLLQASQVPVEPLVDTLLPASRGQYHGQVSGQVLLKGAGIAGADWTKNLTGQIAFNYTNANMAVVSPRAQKIITPISVLLGIPEIQQTPVDAITGRLQLGQGLVDVQQFTVLSTAYQADGQGTLTLTPVFTNSPVDIPVTIALQRSLAQKVNLIPAGSTSTAEYVKLPAFARVKGTVGAYETKTDKMVIAGLLAKSALGIAGTAGGQVGNALTGVTGLLSGDKSVLTNLVSPSNLNVSNVLGQLGGVLAGGKSSVTNSLTNLVPSIGSLPSSIASTNPALSVLTNLFPAAKTGSPSRTNKANLFRNLFGR